MTAQQNFFAFIKDDSGSCQIKRIRVNQTLQTELSRIFNEQKTVFENGVDTDIEFNGDWKPESNEVLFINDLVEATTMVNAITANASSFSDVVISNFSNEPIKAIFTGFTSSNVTTVYLQKFSSRQALSLNELPILKMQTGNTFVKTTEDLFTLDNKLVAVIQGNQTKFKSFHNARMVFDLSEQYREATDEDLTELSQHSSLEIADVTQFISNADNQVRKMAHTISSSDVLGTYSVTDISTAANNFPEVTITVNNGKLVLPTEKRELKEVLHFLLEDIYKGPLSGSSYLTNSKRSI
jgi:antitoxin component of MazEF toxin-antitoxin module